MINKIISWFKKEKKKPHVLNKKEKKERALEYIESILDIYDKRRENTNNVFSKISNCSASLEMIKIKSQIITGQIKVNDEFLIVLEKTIMEIA